MFVFYFFFRIISYVAITKNKKKKRCNSCQSSVLILMTKELEPLDFHPTRCAFVEKPSRFVAFNTPFGRYFHRPLPAGNEK